MTFSELFAQVEALRLASDWTGIIDIITFENVRVALNCANKAAPEDPQNTKDMPDIFQEYQDLVTSISAAADTGAIMEFFISGNILMNQVGREYRTAYDAGVTYFTSVGHPTPETISETRLDAYIDDINSQQNPQIPSACS